jgi:hypothetical protein
VEKATEELEARKKYSILIQDFMFAFHESHSTEPITQYMRFALGRDLPALLQNRIETQTLHPLEFYDFAVEYAFWMEMFLNVDKPMTEFLTDERLGDFMIFERLEGHRESLRNIFPLAILLPSLRDLDFQDFFELLPYPVFPVGLIDHFMKADGFQLSPLRMVDHDTFHALRQLILSYGLAGTGDGGVPLLSAGTTRDVLETIVRERVAFQTAAFQMGWLAGEKTLLSSMMVWFGNFHEENKPMKGDAFKEPVSIFKYRDMKEGLDPSSPFAQVTEKSFRDAEHAFRSRLYHSDGK